MAGIVANKVSQERRLKDWKNKELNGNVIKRSTALLGNQQKNNVEHRHLRVSFNQLFLLKILIRN